MLSMLFFTIAHAQTTSNCLEIEHIHVDACGNPEGQNEMLRVLVGPNPLTISNININWPNPNNSFYGFVQNAGTAIKTTTLNSTIQGCGWLKEPTGGILPANSKVIIVTSYLMNPAFNSFAGLSDTMYILYQNSTVTSGHYANYDSAPGLRTTTISYGGCSESVTYDRSLLAGVDGAGVTFAQNGTATYVANGCNAPVTLTQINASISGNLTAYCPTNPFGLQATWVGSGTFLGWTENGQGTLNNPASASPTYSPNPSENGNISFIASFLSTCGDTIRDTVQIGPQSPIAFQINPAPSIQSICPGQTLTLSVPAANYTNGPIWSTLATGTSIQVSTPNTYIVGATDQCYTYADTVQIIAGISPSVTVSPDVANICQGQNIQITSSGVVGNITWSNGATGTSITVNTPGTYVATASNACGTSRDTAIISLENYPIVNIQHSGNTPIICPNSTISLEAIAQHAQNIAWTHGPTSPLIQVNQAGTYTVIATNACGSDTATIQLQNGANPLAEIQAMGNTSFCKGEQLLLQGVGNGDFEWSNGSSESTITVSNEGIYTLIVSNECGSDTADIFIQVSGPTANFDFSGGDQIPTTIQYINNSTGGDTYAWQLANNETSNLFEPSQYFTDGGDFPITLVVSDANGCKDSLTKIILLEEAVNFFMPNIFTPNGDSINETFSIVATGISSFQMLIFNRWGEVVYQSDDIYQGWNGKNKFGQLCSSGVYSVVVSYTIASSGKSEKRNGHVTLIY